MVNSEAFAYRRLPKVLGTFGRLARRMRLREGAVSVDFVRIASSTAMSTCDWRANGSSAMASSVACNRFSSSRMRAAFSN